MKQKYVEMKDKRQVPKRSTKISKAKHNKGVQQEAETIGRVTRYQYKLQALTFCRIYMLGMEELLSTTILKYRAARLDSCFFCWIIAIIDYFTFLLLIVIYNIIIKFTYIERFLLYPILLSICSYDHVIDSARNDTIFIKMGRASRKTLRKTPWRAFY